jgi:hypothetical protein
MMRIRFPVSGLWPALALGAAAALTPAADAQSEPVAQATRIDDIQVSQSEGTVSILVKLSQQPGAASAEAKNDRLTLAIDGVSLAPLSFDPAPGSLLSHVAASGTGDGASTITLDGAAFADASTTIYRNAVLIEAKLAEPGLTAAASLMPDRSPRPASPPPAASAPVLHPATPAAKAERAPISLVGPVAVDIAAHSETTGLSEPSIELEAVAAAEPVAAIVAPAPHSDQGLESHLEIQPAATVSRPENDAITGRVTGLAHVAAERCTAVTGLLERDPWDISALGDHALCLIDAGKLPEAGNRLDQLAAFAPEDWRVALGRAVLDQEKGDASNAVIGYRNAAMLAPDPDMRAAISRAADAAAQN